MTKLIDPFGREITYLRVSVTDRCNLRCIYCMPEEGVKLKSHSDILRIEELARIVNIASGLGITRVRLTGGETLVRQGILALVSLLSEIPGICDLSMSTNGVLLSKFATRLSQAGLNRVNVSLDTLKPERFKRITRHGKLESVLAGLEAAEGAGLSPIKINTVVMKGVNHDEIRDLAMLTKDHPWIVRFIEFMPFWNNGWKFGAGYVMPISEIRNEMIARGAYVINPNAGENNQRDQAGKGPANYIKFPEFKGSIGFISLRDHICSNCNRIRLTADGLLLPCLLSNISVDLRTPLRDGADDGFIAGLIRKAVSLKPENGEIAQVEVACSGGNPSLSKIGG
ncbi:MAG: GTP 3',8-cyclase MoaA [Firmicutes bacterium]|nr:GTP 3',8-cyclase MoaA [Bacillota bacterium]